LLGGIGLGVVAAAGQSVEQRTAPFINGYFTECYRSKTAKEHQIAVGDGDIFVRPEPIQPQ
jgi:hypothetical protein